MDEAAEKLEEATEAVFEDLEQQTGTTPSTSGCGALKDNFLKNHSDLKGEYWVW